MLPLRVPLGQHRIHLINEQHTGGQLAGKREDSTHVAQLLLGPAESCLCLEDQTAALLCRACSNTQTGLVGMQRHGLFGLSKPNGVKARWKQLTGMCQCGWRRPCTAKRCCCQACSKATQLSHSANLFACNEAQQTASNLCKVCHRPGCCGQMRSEQNLWMTLQKQQPQAGMICAQWHASSSRQREGTKTWQGSPSGRGVGVAEAAARLPSGHLWLLTAPPPQQNQLLPHLSSPAHGTR